MPARDGRFAQSSRGFASIKVPLFDFAERSTGPSTDSDSSHDTQRNVIRRCSCSMTKNANPR
jgi:hypothetical protein